MPDEIYAPSPKTPISMFPKDGDTGSLSIAKSLMASHGGFGGIVLANTEKYRDPTAYPQTAPQNNKKIPTLAMYCKVDVVLTACVFAPGHEWRGPTGTVLTTLNLVAGVVHQVALTSFTLTTGTDLHIYLSEPWVALVAP